VEIEQGGKKPLWSLSFGIPLPDGGEHRIMVTHMSITQMPIGTTSQSPTAGPCASAVS
jgi:hypothetical protein